MKPLTKTAVASIVAVTGIAAARLALAAYTPETSGLTVAATALYGTDSGVRSDIVDIVGGAINAVLSLVGAFFLALIIYAGSLWMTARGAADQLKRAQNTMTSAVIGIIFVMGAYTVTGFVIDQVIDATGGGSSTEVVEERQDAVNRPESELEGCTSEDITACLNDFAGNDSLTEEEKNTLCTEACSGGTEAECDAQKVAACLQGLTSNGSSNTAENDACYVSANCTAPVSGGTNCDTARQIVYENCLKGGGDTAKCVAPTGCSGTVAITDADKAAQLADCWASDVCKGKPPTDAECIKYCGGSPIATEKPEDKTAACIDTCVNVNKFPLSECQTSCSGENPIPNPPASEWKNCVDQCVADQTTFLTDPDKKEEITTICQQGCIETPDEAANNNWMASDTCFSECYAQKLKIGDIEINPEAKLYYCTKMCINPEAVTPEIIYAECWNISPYNAKSNIDRVTDCLVDDVCWDTCNNNPNKDTATCLSDCKMDEHWF